MALNEAAHLHIVMPRDVVAAVDRLAGRRKRSEFIAEVVREKLTRELQRAALAATACALAGAEYPEWETPEKTSAWVHDGRRCDDAHTDEKLRGSATERRWQREDRGV